MTNPNVLCCGSTRSGKSLAELRRLIEAAEAGFSIVLIDPHRDSLAWRFLEQLVACGLERRILYDRLSDLDQMIGYDFLPKPSAPWNTLQYITERDELIRSFCDILVRRRQMESLATAAQTEEWVIPPLILYIDQFDHPSLQILQHAFGPPDHRDFRRLLSRCRNDHIVRQFEDIASGKIRRGQYAAAERLIRGVCSSPAFAFRCGSSFHLSSFLDRGGILILEGGGTISDDAQRTMMGAVILQTIRYVRSRPRPHPPVILALDEATNAGLIGASGYEMRAAAECQKMNLGIHTLVQSLNFPSTEITEGMLTNSLRHEWFFAANPSVIQKAVSDLGNKDYEAQLRSLRPGERIVKDRDRVFREYVPLLPDVWGFPGLTKKKAERALAEIKQRPEYRTPSLQIPSDTPHEQPRATTLLPPEEPNSHVGI